MIHCLIVDLIQLGLWELCDRLTKDIKIRRQTLRTSQARLLEDRAMRPTVPDEGARRRNRSRGSAPQETPTRAHLPVRSLVYGRRTNPGIWGYLSFSSRGTGPSTYPTDIDLSKTRKRHGKMTAHDIFRVPIHHRVRQVETFDVGSCRRLDFLWEAEVATQLDHLS